jgi:hypothetical protein
VPTSPGLTSSGATLRAPTCPAPTLQAPRSIAPSCAEQTCPVPTYRGKPQSGGADVGQPATRDLVQALLFRPKRAAPTSPGQT